MRYLLDSNVLLYHVNGALADPLPLGEYFVSVITRIEALSFPALTEAEESRIADFLSDVEVVGLTQEVEEETIRIRKTTRLKMADAVIAATAVVTLARMLTHDTALLNLEGLDALSPKLK